MSIKKKSLRIFHGPGTIGGISYHLANWQKSKGIESQCIVYSDYGNRQLFDENLNIYKFPRIKRLKIQIKFLIKILKTYDLIHFCSDTTFLPYNIDLPILKIFRKKMVMTFCGSDIRLKEIHSKRNKYTNIYPYSKYHSDFKIILKLKFFNLFIDRFFAVREVYAYAKHCIPCSKITNKPWINNIGFDISKAKYNQPTNLKKEIISIVHAPSNLKVKGTKYVRKAISEVKKLGYKINYRELVGIPNQKVQEIISSSDIVIDQMLLGEAGTLCFEGMGLGKPVISYYPDELKSELYPDFPIFNANIDNLKDKIIELTNNEKLRFELGKKGRKFVLENLNYNKVQEEVLDEYRKIGFNI